MRSSSSTCLPVGGGYRPVAVWNGLMARLEPRPSLHHREEGASCTCCSESHWIDWECLASEPPELMAGPHFMHCLSEVRCSPGWPQVHNREGSIPFLSPPFQSPPFLLCCEWDPGPCTCWTCCPSALSTLSCLERWTEQDYCDGQRRLFNTNQHRLLFRECLGSVSSLTVVWLILGPRYR